MKVAVKNTAFSNPATFARAVYGAFRRQGQPRSAALLLTAHVAVSTGWGRGLYNWILAGIKAGPSGACYGTAPVTYSGDYVCLCTFERTGSGNWAQGCSDCSPKNGIPRCRHPFRAYTSIDAGAAGMLGVLSQSRYARSRALLSAGDQRYFAQVGVDGWYTAPISTTSAAMQRSLIQIKKYLNLTTTPQASGMGPLVLGAMLVGGYFARRP